MDELPLSSKRSEVNWKLYYAGVGVVVAMVGITLFLAGMYMSGVGRQSVQNVEMTLPVETPVASATPEPVLIRDGLVVSVYNATGVGGAASKAMNILVKLGYKQGKVDMAAVEEGNRLVVGQNIASMSAKIAADMGQALGLTFKVDEHNLDEAGVIAVYLGK